MSRRSRHPCALDSLRLPPTREGDAHTPSHVTPTPPFAAFRETEKARTIEAAAKKAVRVGEKAVAVPIEGEGDDAADADADDVVDDAEEEAAEAAE